MRITNQLQHSMLSGHIIRNQSDVYRFQEQIASGERMQVASDDPQSWAAASRLTREQDDLECYKDNALKMKTRLASLDLSLKSMGDILSNASEMAVRAGQSVLNEKDRAIMAEEVDQLLEELVMQANMKFDGQYVFGGTQSGSESFGVQRNADGKIESVSYAGNEQISSVQISAGDSMGLQMIGGGSNGVLISDEANAFSALIDMRDKLLANENLAETNVQKQVDDAFNQVLIGRANAGAQQERLTLINSFRETQKVQLQKQISSYTSVDTAEVVAKMSAKNVAYEAALVMSAKSMNISLLKYI